MLVMVIVASQCFVNTVYLYGLSLKLRFVGCILREVLKIQKCCFMGTLVLLKEEIVLLAVRRLCSVLCSLNIFT